MNKKILFISYVFPPTGGAGIQRTVKLVKYFHKLGWEPYILTAKNPSVPVYDYEMLKDIPEDIPVYKSVSLEIPYGLKRRLWGGTVKTGNDEKQNQPQHSAKKSLKQKITGFVKFFVHLIMMPDPQIGWNFFTRKKAKKIIKKHDIGFVFISAPPFSSLLLVPELAKSGAKVVADFRDEWTEFYLKSYDFHQRDEYTARKIIQMEKDVVESAHLITMATNSFVNNYSNKYKSSSSKIKLLTNGYDVDDFKGKEKQVKDDHIFNITYTGTIFNVTTARFLLQALGNLFKENDDIKKGVKITFVGRITDEEKVYFDEFPYKEQLALPGYVSHDQSVAYLYGADLLVVIVDELEGSERIIAAKIFEYINTGIPILALVPEKGEIAAIVNATQTGLVISNRNVPKISEALKGFISNEYTFTRNESEIKKYSRENIANQLIDYLKEL